MITSGGWLGIFIALTNTGHLFCPMLIFGLHDELRSSWRYQMLAAGVAMFLAFTLPLWLVIGVYTAWNLYHYAMQHNGFWQITRWRARTREQRLTMRTSWLALTAIGVFETPLAGAISVFHWFGDIGLSAWSTQRRTAFLILLTLLAATGLVLMNHGLREAFPALVRLRLGLGFVHFMISAAVWPAALSGQHA